MAFIKTRDDHLFGEMIINTDMISDIHISKGKGRIIYIVRCGDSQCFHLSIEEIKKVFDVIGISL